MTQRPALGTVARIDGDLYECVSIGEGVTVTFRRVGSDECPTCGRNDTRSFLLHAPNYRSDVQPVVTVSAV